MKKTVFVAIGLMFCVTAFCKPIKRFVEWDGNNWILNTRKSKVEKLKGSKYDCGEGIFFLYEDGTYKRFLVDSDYNKLSDKDFKHVGLFSNGKTVVSGYQEEQYETDRIYDVVTDTVSEPLQNLWVYCAFVKNLGAFSFKNKNGELKAVLCDLDLKNVTGWEFDEFCELDFSKTIWHFKKDGKDYFIDQNGEFKK